MVRRSLNVCFALAAACSSLIFIAAIGLGGRSLFVQDEWRWWERRMARDVYTRGDAYTARLSRFATSGRGGLALGQSISWQRTDEGELSADPPFEHETYPPAYPIYPESERPQHGTQRTFAGFQFRTVVSDADGGSSPVMKDGRVVRGDDGQIIMAAPRISLADRESIVVVPLWAVTTAASVLPAAWFARRRRRRRVARRQERGECVHCGYQLRSGGGHARCPECGQATAAAA